LSQAATKADRAALELQFAWANLGPVERDVFDHGRQGGPQRLWFGQGERFP